MFEIYRNNEKITEFEKGANVYDVAWALDDYCNKNELKQAYFTMYSNEEEVIFNYVPHITANEDYILHALVKLNAMDVTVNPWCKGYISRNLSIGEIYFHKDCHGEGYIAHYPSWASTQYHPVKYFTWK